VVVRRGCAGRLQPGVGAQLLLPIRRDARFSAGVGAGCLGGGTACR